MLSTISTIHILKHTFSKIDPMIGHKTSHSKFKIKVNQASFLTTVDMKLVIGGKLENSEICGN